MDSSIRRIPPDTAASTSRVRPTRRRTDEDRDAERDFAAELEERRKGKKQDAPSEPKSEGKAQPPAEDRAASDEDEAGGSLDVVA